MCYAEPMKSKLRLVLFGSILTPIFMGVAAYAQDNPAPNPNTSETDQSEEDWRNSRRKKETNPDEILDAILGGRNNGGWTIPTGPASPVESLPQESRRHIMKERARAMAETAPGQEPSSEYNPSDAAKSDPDLAEQEKEAWEYIMTDLKGGQSQGQPGQEGPHKVAVGGQGGGQSGSQGNSTMRGGSTATAAEILAAIKSGRLGGGSGQSGEQPAGAGGSGPEGIGAGQSGQQSQSQGQAGQSQSGEGQSDSGAQSSGQPNSGQPNTGQSSQDQSGSHSGAPSSSTGPRGGSAQSVADILNGIKGAQGGQSGAPQSGENSGAQNQGAQSPGSVMSGSPANGSENTPSSQPGSSETQSQSSVSTPTPQQASQRAAQAAANSATTAANEAVDQAIASGNPDALRAAAESSDAAKAAREAASESAQAQDVATAEAAAQAAEAAAAEAQAASDKAKQLAGQNSPQAEQAVQPMPETMEDQPIAPPAQSTGEGVVSSASDYLKKRQTE